MSGPQIWDLQECGTVAGGKTPPWRPSHTIADAAGWPQRAPLRLGRLLREGLSTVLGSRSGGGEKEWHSPQREEPSLSHGKDTAESEGSRRQFWFLAAPPPTSAAAETATWLPGKEGDGAEKGWR